MVYLFDKWGQIKKKIEKRPLYIFLDYDGTLAPIVDKPKQALMDEETKDLLKDLAANHKCKVSIISGRSLKDIKRIVGLPNIVYAGNHGLEIQGPKVNFRVDLPYGSRAMLKRIKNELLKKVFSIKGALLENKGLSLALHYRMVRKRQAPALKKIFYNSIAFYAQKYRIKIKSGKKVLEVRLPIEWNKGNVVLWLLDRQKLLAKDKSFFPIYLGDDKTDEDAFKALKDKGLSVFVGRKKNSQAQYYLKNTSDVSTFLRILCQN